MFDVSLEIFCWLLSFLNGSFGDHNITCVRSVTIVQYSKNEVLVQIASAGSQGSDEPVLLRSLA